MKILIILITSILSFSVGADRADPSEQWSDSVAEQQSQGELNINDESMFDSGDNADDTLSVDEEGESLQETPEDGEISDIDDEIPMLDDESGEESFDVSDLKTYSNESNLALAGSASIEYWYFERNGLGRDQKYHHNFSLMLAPELSYQWDDAKQSLVFVPFFRLDQRDKERTHFDVRELLWSRSMDAWALRAGIGKVFWGVTESRHTVDIINQTDFVENYDTEDKLGQQMVNLAYTTDNIGTFDFFLLPGSRIRTFRGQNGRPRFILRIDADSPIFREGASRHHIDFAVRWSHTLGDWDLGLAHFRGTTREPRFIPVFSGPGLPTRLRPVYEVINQTSIDVQAVKGSWLWKLEAFTRSGQNRRFLQLTGGFEYTYSGAFDSGADVGILMEYLYDARDEDDLLSPLDDDIFFATRIGFNDVQSTEVLAGIIYDPNNSTWIYNIEASRRIGDSWKAYLEIRGFTHADRDDIAFGLRQEDYVMFELQRYF